MLIRLDRERHFPYIRAALLRLPVVLRMIPFQDTLKDPEFLADAEKAKLDIEPITGEEMEKMVEKLFKLSPATVTKLKDILGAK